MTISQTNDADEKAKADGILRFMLGTGRGTSKQVAWLIGYIRRLRKQQPQEPKKAA